MLPGDTTESSALLYLMNGQGSLRMPPDAPLPGADIDLISRWITALPGAMQRLIVFVFVVGACLLAAAGRADAYPQFQFSSGTNRCSQCHYSPAGRRSDHVSGAATRAATRSAWAATARFLHGAWSPPSWLALGADIRLATTYLNDDGQESPRIAFFPMQADVYLRFAFGDAFSLYVTGGRARRGPAAEDDIPDQFGTLGDRFISREHYLMWRPSATGPYARIGRFYAPYGIRFVEHIYYVRRYTGYELYNETYTASGGYVADDWELHVSVFTPPPSGFPDQLQAVGARESGGAVYVEKRLASDGGARRRRRASASASEMNRYQVGRRRQAMGRAGEDAAAGRGRLHPPGGEGGRLRPEPVRGVRWARRSSRCRGRWSACSTSASRRTCRSRPPAATPTTCR